MINIESYDINDEECKNYSIEFSKLIDFIKKIRVILKSAKFHVIKVLNIKIKKSEKKQKLKNEENCSKVKNKNKEVDFLENADLDSLARLIFANKYTERDLDKLGDKLSIEDRVVVRLSSFNQLQKLLTEFRSEHNDWEELCDVLLYKNSSGKIKSCKSRKTKVSIPLPCGASEEVTKEATVVFTAPLLDSKKDEELKIRKKKAKENRKSKLKKETEPLCSFEVSDEVLCDFIKNEDDLDEWEKDIEMNEEEEFNLMAPLVPDLEGEKKSSKGNNIKNSKIKKRKPFPKNNDPKPTN